jgi:hypothetical protein
MTARATVIQFWNVTPKSVKRAASQLPTGYPPIPKSYQKVIFAFRASGTNPRVGRKWTALRWLSRIKMLRDAADRDTTDAPEMIQGVSSFVVKSSARITSAIAMVTGSTSASRASGAASARRLARGGSGRRSVDRNLACCGRVVSFGHELARTSPCPEPGFCMRRSCWR